MSTTIGSWPSLRVAEWQTELDDVQEDICNLVDGTVPGDYAEAQDQGLGYRAK